MCLPEERVPSCPRCPLVRSAFEADQLHTAALVAALPGLPLEDLLPCALVHGVVYGDDDLHVGLLRIVVLARHGGEELGLGGVYPLTAIDAGYGRRFAVEGECGGGCRGVGELCCIRLGVSAEDGGP